HIASRVLAGCSAGMVIPGVTCWIAGLSAPKGKARIFGDMSDIISVGLILGPGIGRFLEEILDRRPCVFAGVLGVLAVICSFLFVVSPERAT
ncbi:MFS transporter, partial [Staphylococcus pseudintermedius]